MAWHSVESHRGETRQIHQNFNLYVVIKLAHSKMKVHLYYYFCDDALELLDGLDSRARGVLILLEARLLLCYFVFRVGLAI